MKELKTKKSAEGARVKEKSDALPRAAKHRLRTQAGRYSGRLCLCGQNGKRTNGRMHRQ